jgi:hypothetical protein
VGGTATVRPTRNRLPRPTISIAGHPRASAHPQRTRTASSASAARNTKLAAFTAKLPRALAAIKPASCCSASIPYAGPAVSETIRGRPRTAPLPRRPQWPPRRLPSPSPCGRVPEGGATNPHSLSPLHIRVARSPHLQPDRRARQLEHLPQAVNQIPPVILRQPLRPRPEHDERGRPRLRLCHIP